MKTGDNPFSMFALTYVEQLVIKSLYGHSTAVNAWQIYRDVIGYYMIGDSEEARATNTRNYNTEFRNEGLVTQIKDAKVVLPTNKAEVNKIIRSIRKEEKDKHNLRATDNKVPSFVKFIRIMRDMFAVGWVKKRTDGLGKSKALYYIDEEARAKVASFYGGTFEIEEELKQSKNRR